MSQHRNRASSSSGVDHDLLRELTTQIRAAFGAAGASLTVLTGPRAPLRVCVPRELELLELVQDRHHAGPVPEAVAAGETVVVADLARGADRWPDFSRAATAAGIRSCLAIPLQLDRTSVGVMATYGTDPRSVDDREVALATLVGALVAHVVVSSRALQDKELLARQLQEALDSRVALEQAKGIVSATQGLEIQSAFELIRASARRNNRTIASVARQIVEGGPQPADRSDLQADDSEQV